MWSSARLCATDVKRTSTLPKKPPDGPEHGDGFNGDTYRIIASVKVRDVIKMIEKDGWYHVGTEGDHRQYKHRTKKGRVTISGHPDEDMPKGTLNNVFKQAGLEK